MEIYSRITLYERSKAVAKEITNLPI